MICTCHFSGLTLSHFGCLDLCLTTSNQIFGCASDSLISCCPLITCNGAYVKISASRPRGAASNTPTQQGFSHRLGGVRFFDAGVKILTHRCQHDTQCRAPKKGPVCSWFGVQILMQRHLCENSTGQYSRTRQIQALIPQDCFCRGGGERLTLNQSECEASGTCAGGKW